MLVEKTLILLMMAAVLFGPAIMIARLGQSVVKASARNPAMVNRLFWGMFALLIFIEVIAILVTLVLFRLFTR